MSHPSLISTREAASRLGITTRTVARWVEAGTLTPAVQAPGRYGAFLFDAEQIDRLASAEAVAR